MENPESHGISIFNFQPRKIMEFNWGPWKSHMISEFTRQRDKRKFSKPMISRKITKLFCKNFEKSVIEWEKWLHQERSSGTSATQIFSCLYYVQVTRFRIQFEINLHKWVSQKAKIAISAFWKTRFKLNEKKHEKIQLEEVSEDLSWRNFFLIRKNFFHTFQSKFSSSFYVISVV